MNMMKLKMIMIIATAIMMTVMMIGTTSATVTHVVGGNVGWKAVNYNLNFYKEWAERRIFGVGDKLVFSYNGPSSNLMRVTKQDYEKCTQLQPITSWSSGPTTLELSEPGHYYFIGGAGLYCQLGQKLHIRVVPGPGKPGPVDFDFHFAPVRRELDGGEEEDDSPAEKAAKDAANGVVDNAMAATGANDAIDKANKTANDAVNNTIQGAAQQTNKAVNKTVDSVTSSSTQFKSLGLLCTTLFPILVAMCT